MARLVVDRDALPSPTLPPLFRDRDLLLLRLAASTAVPDRCDRGLCYRWTTVPSPLASLLLSFQSNRADNANSRR